MKAHLTSTMYRFYLIVAMLASLLASALHATPAYAAGIVVTTEADSVADDGACSLREAINAANTDTASGAATGECSAGSGADTITFNDNYTITLAGSQLPAITTAITIAGNEAANNIIQADTNPNDASYRVLEVAVGGDLTLKRVTVRYGRCDGSCTDFANGGGGIINYSGNLSIIESSVSGNSAPYGGGVFNYGGGTITVTSSTFLNNTASYFGGGILNAYSTMTVTNSSFTGNSADAGGGISNYGLENLPATTNITNSTLSGNGARWGGGVYQSSTGATTTLKNTIVANSSGGGSCSGAITDGGSNLDSGTSCGWGADNGSLSSTDPMLDALSANGGPTRTMKLLAGSPAIDAGNDTTCANTDQRGVARPQGSHCDIGAYEVTTPKTISGNAGAGDVILSYTDETSKTVTSQPDGSYSLTVPYGWSGTVTPSHPCYTFVPSNRNYPGVTTDQTAQDYTATFNASVCGPKTISGNVGAPGVTTLSYTDGTPKTITSNLDGSYSFTVPYGWSGTVTPSNICYIFDRTSISYTNVITDQPSQDYSAGLKNDPSCTLELSGKMGAPGKTTLSYTDTDGTAKTVTSGLDGSYSLTVPYGWSGTVTPSNACYTFSSASRPYSNVTTDQTSQDYTAVLNSDPICSPKLSGKVGAPGVTTLSYTDANGTPKTAITYGNYSLTVPYGWSGTVTPSNPCYTFSRASNSYSNVTADISEDYTAAFNNAPVCGVTVGVFRPGNGVIFLKNSNTSGFADLGLNYGLGGDYPVTGDWDDDGTDTIGVYRGDTFLLRNSNTVGYAELNFTFGSPGDQPIVGDWDGDGRDTIGVFRPSTGLFALRNRNSAGPQAAAFKLNIPWQAGDIAIAGDWNGDGVDTVGIFRPSNGDFYLTNTTLSEIVSMRGSVLLKVAPVDVTLNYGMLGDKPVVGDWNGDGKDTIGVYRGNRFLLRNSNTTGAADITLDLGIPGDMPIAGNWDGKP